MKYYRLIAPEWLLKNHSELPKVLEGMYSDEDVKSYNEAGYNVYYFPNHPKTYDLSRTVNGTQIDTFNYVFVDYDCKSGIYTSKEEFVDLLVNLASPPTKIVDSGNGIHAYWKVSDLDVKSYQRLTRRMMRFLQTDEATCMICQLMRFPGTLNTKLQDAYVPCTEFFGTTAQFTCEELDKFLPPITLEDEAFCQQHYDRTYNLNDKITEVDDELPAKFGKLLQENHEVAGLFAGATEDRSKNDFRLGHIMYANKFTKDEAMSVLVNTAKAMSRAPVHRFSYAENIVNKIWTYETEGIDTGLSPTVRDILSKGEETLKGIRFPCNKLIDDTIHGFRLGQVIGIIGGSGVGKTTLTLNTFLWFAEHNPEYHHFFFSLEQPPGEIANRIRTICQGNTALFDKIHIVSNYAEDGTFRHFSIDSIEEHLLEFEKKSGHKVGTTVVDHIGVLAKSDKNGESEGLIGICRRMKAVAVKVNMMLIMLSQAPREKCGIGDLELNKDSAFGTVFFESFLDYCICLWQPLKRVYSMGAPTIMAIKFGKIRHKKQGYDKIQEDICYQLFFDPETERLRELTQDEEVSAKYYVGHATAARKADRKTDIVPYKSRRVENDA